MGSILSGRRNGKPLVENCLTLDLAWLMRKGPIREGQVRSGTVKWHAAGLPIGSARFRLDLRDELAPRLSLVVAGDGVVPIRQTVALTSTDQNFGGRRWWMRCPVTGKRTRMLHLMPDGDSLPAGRRSASRTGSSGWIISTAHLSACSAFGDG